MQMHCSEFQEWLIHLNRKQFQEWLIHLNRKHFSSAFYCPYTLVPDPENFSNFLKLWSLYRRWVGIPYNIRIVVWIVWISRLGIRWVTVVWLNSLESLGVL
jgi:hypothetical protein